jgi:lysophospholipase L1-like esterase
MQVSTWAVIGALASGGGLSAQQTILYEMGSGAATGYLEQRIYGMPPQTPTCIGPLASFPPAQLNSQAGNDFLGNCVVNGVPLVTDSTISGSVQTSQNLNFTAPSSYVQSVTGSATQSLTGGSIAASATVSSVTPAEDFGGIYSQSAALVANPGPAGKPPQFWITVATPGSNAIGDTCNILIEVSGASGTWTYNGGLTPFSNAGTYMAQPDSSPGPGPYTMYIRAQAQAAASPPSTTTCTISWKTYVALGDSFAAGAGDPPYGPTQADTGCARSLQGFPIRMNLPIGLVFAACSGGQTADLLQTPEPDTTQKMAQLDFIGTDQSPGSAVSLVTVMIGGNNLLLFPILEFCALTNIVSLGQPCSSATFPGSSTTMATLFTIAAAKLNNSLVNVYQEIRTRAPNARIVVPLYPNPFPSGARGLLCTFSNGLLLGDADQAFLGNAVDELNTLIRVAAGQSGVGVEVVDLNSLDNSQFPSHGLCANFSWFIVPFSTSMLGAVIHPNSPGEAEMARILGDYLTGTTPPLNPQLNPQATVQQGQTYGTTANVSANQGSAVFSSSWPGSDVVMTLVSPSGKVFNRSTSNPLVSHINGPTFERYTILLPEAGIWTMNFYGANVAAGGEPLSYAFTTLPRYPGDADGDGMATCNDLAIVKAAFGAKLGQPNFDPRGDLNNDGVVNVLDLSLVAKNLLSGAVCQ